MNYDSEGEVIRRCHSCQLFSLTFVNEHTKPRVHLVNKFLRPLTNMDFLFFFSILQFTKYNWSEKIDEL